MKIVQQTSEFDEMLFHCNQLGFNNERVSKRESITQLKNIILKSKYNEWHRQVYENNKEKNDIQTIILAFIQVLAGAVFLWYMQQKIFILVKA